MSRYSKGFRFRLLAIGPELELLETESEQRAAWRAVRRQVWRGRYAWFNYLLMPAVFGFGIRTLMRPIGAALHVDSIMPQRVYDALFMAALIFSCSCLSLWLMRRRFQFFLRAYLNAHGVPCCMNCGFNRSGDDGALCPECGDRADSLGRLLRTNDRKGSPSPPRGRL